MRISFMIQSKIDPARVYVRFRYGRKMDFRMRTVFFVKQSEWNQREGTSSNEQVKEGLQKIFTFMIEAVNKRPVKSIPPDFTHDLLVTSHAMKRARAMRYYNSASRELSDSYIKHVLGKHLGLKRSQITEEIIALKRAQIQYSRLIKRLKNKNK